MAALNFIVGQSTRLVTKNQRNLPLQDLISDLLDSAVCRADSRPQIALACGFVNQGSFAAEYRRVYGELPSETLRAAQRDGQSCAVQSSHTSAAY